MERVEAGRLCTCGVSFFNVNDEEVSCGGKVVYKSLELVKFEEK